MTSHMNLPLRYDAFEAVATEDLAAQVARLGALPQAPLAMPKQKLEHDRTWLRRILRLSHVGTPHAER